MTRRLLSTRISREAFDALKRRATRARQGESTYAARALEKLLLVEEDADLASRRAGGALSTEVVLRLLTELLYTSAALDRFLGKQPGLSAQLRAEAAAQAAKLMGDGGAPEPEPTPTKGRAKAADEGAERSALLDRLIGGPSHGR